MRNFPHFIWRFQLKKVCDPEPTFCCTAEFAKVFILDNSFLLAVMLNLNISHFTLCHPGKYCCVRVQFWYSSGNLEMISSSVSSSVAYCNILVCLTVLSLSSPVFDCVLLLPSLLPHPLCPLLPCHLPLSVCLLSYVVLQGSLSDVIYAISFASVRGEHPEANTLHAECSCGRLWTSTDWAIPFQYHSTHNAMTMHV